MARVKDYIDKEKYVKKANEVEGKYGIPKNLLVGLLATESAFDPDVISGKRKSSSGAMGIAQFMPGTARDYKIDPLNTDQAIDAAGRYLSSSYKYYGNWDDSLRSYNAGLATVNSWKAGKRTLPKETQEYVGKVYKNSGITYSNSVAPYMDMTNDLSILYKPTISGNFEGVPDVYKEAEKEEVTKAKEEISQKEKEEVTKAKEEISQKEKEYNFIQEMRNRQQSVAQEEQYQEEQYQEEQPEESVMDIFNNVSQFVDQPIAQLGGRVDNVDKYGNPLVSKENYIFGEGLYVVPNAGKPKVVHANTGEHTFKGATKFTEYPIKNKQNGR